MFGSGFGTALLAFAGVDMGTEGMLARKLCEKWLAGSTEILCLIQLENCLSVTSTGT
jgi:hypothetical protein